MTYKYAKSLPLGKKGYIASVKLEEDKEIPNAIEDREETSGLATLKANIDKYVEITETTINEKLKIISIAEKTTTSVANKIKEVEEEALEVKEAGLATEGILEALNLEEAKAKIAALKEYIVGTRPPRFYYDSPKLTSEHVLAHLLLLINRLGTMESCMLIKREHDSEYAPQAKR
ncbi:hypothetical protein B0A48_03571 [Cryoendolithus antarcticus]|uniref:Uncharacterized protein n=1 Tax=Cryoendolithus antarcticus TaxID=1507870 RepID=A0A1V8TKK9_9PEZI|nr:hypothetical protein B0A48_03571 [Cryoendolithus antarcticus]